MAVNIRPRKKTLPIEGELTDQVIKDIEFYLTEGATRELACLATGISLSKFEKWMRIAESRDVECDELHLLLLRAVKMAEAKRKIEALKRINEAAIGGKVIKRTEKHLPNGTVISEETFSTGDWRADQWYLERRDPNSYGKMTPIIQQPISDKDDGDSYLDYQIEKVLGFGNE